MPVHFTGENACPLSLKLSQKPQISALQQPDIVDPVTHHHQPCQSQAKSETVPLLRIEAAETQHIRIHQAARQQLNPAALLAHRTARPAADDALNIQLESRLDKWKKPWPQPYRDLAAKDLLQQRFHEIQQMRH